MRHMPVRIAGVTYYSSGEVLEMVEVSRQTLWRWRQEPGFPQGCRLRGRLLFTQDDLDQIREFAFNIEPLGVNRDPGQLALFGNVRA